MDVFSQGVKSVHHGNYKCAYRHDVVNHTVHQPFVLGVDAQQFKRFVHHTRNVGYIANRRIRAHVVRSAGVIDGGLHKVCGRHRKNNW